MVEHRHDVAGLDRAVGENMEPRATEVRQSWVVHVQDVAQRTNHAGVTDDERSAVPAATTDVEECLGHALDDVLVALETLRLPSLLEVTGPTLLDLGAGEALPRADVGLLQALVHFHGADAEVFSDDRGRVSGSLKVTGSDEFECTERTRREGRLAHTFFAERNVGPPLPAFVDVPQGLSVSQDQQRTHHLATIHGNAG